MLIEEVFNPSHEYALQLMQLKCFEHQNAYRFCDALAAQNLNFHACTAIDTVYGAIDAQRWVEAAYIGWTQAVKHGVHVQLTNYPKQKVA